jgi:hypothetical protein
MSLPYSDPARLEWGSNNPFINHQARQGASGDDQRNDGISVAPSAFSIGAQERRAVAEAMFAREQQEKRVKMEEELRLAEEALLAAKGGGSVKIEQPHESAAGAEEDVVQREMAELSKRYARLGSVMQAKYGRTAPPISLVASVYADDDEDEVAELATTSFKVKVTPPEKWKGRYEHVEREAWIRTVEGYLASLGLKLTARIGRSLTPYPHFIIRSLFSSDATNGSLSALSWFDARDRRDPFLSAQQVLDAVRSHWKDDQAAEAALDAYRGARQGSLRARDFGSRVETLADACFDQTFSESDRMATFVRGLNPAYKDYVKTQLATLVLVGKTPATLSSLVDVAATADGLETFVSSLKSKGSGGGSSTTTPNGAGKKTGTADDLGKVKGETPSSSEEKTRNWRSRAATWQSNHPLSSSSDWRSDGNKKPDQKQYCYNCGRLADHFSRACPYDRKDPKGTTLAALFASLSTTGSSESVENGSGKADEE